MGVVWKCGPCHLKDSKAYLILSCHLDYISSQRRTQKQSTWTWTEARLHHFTAGPEPHSCETTRQSLVNCNAAVLHHLLCFSPPRIKALTLGGQTRRSSQETEARHTQRGDNNNIKGDRAAAATAQVFHTKVRHCLLFSSRSGSSCDGVLSHQTPPHRLWGVRAADANPGQTAAVVKLLSNTSGRL